MSAAAGPQSQLPEYRSNHGSTGQSPSTETEGSAMSGSLSLAMIHRAFGGLLDNSRTLHASNSPRRSELDRSIDDSAQSHRAPNAFSEESYSFRSVHESEDHVVAVEKFETERAHVSPDAVGSVKFFDYLTAIGGI